MFKTPYDTAAGSKVMDSDLKESLSTYVTLNADNTESQIARTKRSENGIAVYRLLSGSADIPAFSQPMYIESSNGNKCVVADVRPFITMTNAKNQEYKVNSFYAYDSLLERTVMEVCWLESGPDRILGLGIYPMRAFCRWITNTLTQRLVLPEDTQYIVMVIACYYYYCLHSENTDRSFSQIDMGRIVGQIHRVTGYEMRNIHELLHELPIIRDINGFVQVLKDKTSFTRIATLASLTPAGVYTLVGNSISGHDPRVTAAIALEHPPTFVALVKLAISYRGAGKSGLGVLLKPTMSTTEATNFLTAYSGLVKQFSQ